MEERRKKTAGEKTWRGGWNETFDSNDDDAGSGDGDSGHSICRGNAAVKRGQRGGCVADTSGSRRF